MTTKRNRELHNDTVIIILSSFSSAITYILIEKATTHLSHPWQLLIYIGLFLIIFAIITMVLKLKK